MAITTFAQLAAAPSYFIKHTKTASLTTVASTWFTALAQAGNPPAGALGGTSTTAGVVPTDATTGFPLIPNFSDTGYVSDVAYGGSVAGRMRLYDLLWKAGAYAFNANTALSAQPSYAGRLPSTNYNETQLWYEQVTAGTGIPSVNITYTNQDGTGSRTTGVTSLVAAHIVGRMTQLPLQAGDTGIQKVDNVTATVASAGTFNILIMRRLWSGRNRTAAGGDEEGPSKTGLPIVFNDSALYPIYAPDSTANGIPDMEITIVSG